MEESRKNDQRIQELDLGKMEQVSGGSGPLPTKTKYCGNCKDTTTWIYLDGGFVCAKCGRSTTAAPYTQR